MKLYLVQHGAALSEEENPDRPLSLRGTKDVERMAEFLQDGEVEVALVEHSGKTRAAQTADVLAPYVGDPRLRKHPGLGPNDDVAPVADDMRSAKENRMLVGHMPFLAKLATLLLSGKEGPHLVSFEPGAALCLERDGDAWRVSSLVTPTLLRK